MNPKEEKKMSKEYQVKSLVELNTVDDYVLNTEVETYTSKGKETLKKGEAVKFLSIVGSSGLILFRDKKGNVDTCHFSLLNNLYESLVGKIVKVPGGITLSTHDGNFFFDNGLFLVESVYMDKTKNIGIEEKFCFIRYISDCNDSTGSKVDMSKLNTTAVTGTIPAYLVEKF